MRTLFLRNIKATPGTYLKVRTESVFTVFALINRRFRQISYIIYVFIFLGRRQINQQAVKLYFCHAQYLYLKNEIPFSAQSEFCPDFAIHFKEFEIRNLYDNVQYFADVNFYLQLA